MDGHHILLAIVDTGINRAHLVAHGKTPLINAMLRHAHQVLKADPRRENAHRLAMRSYVRLGQLLTGATALQSVRVRVRGEFDMDPSH
jgi:hypothetical protein